jgi:protoporphyrinogen oxidase
VIIGAGPAGLTAAYELATRSDVLPIVLEATDKLGGISQTARYKGNCIDIGGHRFFSKSDRVMKWWTEMLPLARIEGEAVSVHYEGKSRTVGPQPDAPDPDKVEDVMLVLPRRSRIYHSRKFFDYPISISGQTIRNLGLWRTARIGLSYLRSQLLPLRPTENLEQFFINRFGRELYRTFFQSYTEKVWGMPCTEISAAWGAQRVKSLSVARALRHALGKPLRKAVDVAQKDVETSLVERFLYPKYGPGQMWEACAGRVADRGGEIRRRYKATRILTDQRRVTGVAVVDLRSEREEVIPADYVFSTMPVRDLVRGVDGSVPDHVRDVSEGLCYRDFITVGLLVNEMKVHDQIRHGVRMLSDTWIYVQEPDVRLGRLQIYNNWSPYMVADPGKVWIGLEYFCYETDDIWKSEDEAIARLGVDEMAHIGLLDPTQVLDWVVIRMPKAYPAYFGSYARMGEIRRWADSFDNLFLIGRNGMHRYNNMDHSMLTAMVAVDNILQGRIDKGNIWDVNTEQDYHEETPERSTLGPRVQHDAAADSGCCEAGTVEPPRLRTSLQ